MTDIDNETDERSTLDRCIDAACIAIGWSILMAGALLMLHFEGPL